MGTSIAHTASAMVMAMLDAIRSFARREPVRFRSIIAGLVAVAVGLGLDIDVPTVLAVLALLGITAETSRRRVTPVKPKGWGRLTS